MSEKIKKCCGTCKHWDHITDTPICNFPFPLLPFWAMVSDGDHESYTEYDQGKICLVYEAVDGSTVC